MALQSRHSSSIPMKREFCCVCVSQHKHLHANLEFSFWQKTTQKKHTDSIMRLRLLKKQECFFLHCGESYPHNSYYLTELVKITASCRNNRTWCASNLNVFFNKTVKTLLFAYEGFVPEKSQKSKLRCRFSGWALKSVGWPTVSPKCRVWQGT